LAPHSTSTVTPFSFLVDTVPPSVPSTPALASWSDTGTIGDNTTAYHNVALLGHSDPGTSMQAFAKTATTPATIIGGATTDANGNYDVATTTLANGTYTIYVIALDEAGNKSTSGSMTLTINDTTTTTLGPTTTTLAPTTTTTTTTTTTLPKTTT